MATPIDGLENAMACAAEIDKSILGEGRREPENTAIDREALQLCIQPGLLDQGPQPIAQPLRKLGEDGPPDALDPEPSGGVSVRWAGRCAGERDRSPALPAVLAA